MAGDVVTTKKAPKTTTELGENGINHNVSRTNPVASTKHSDGAADEATTPKSKTRVPVENTEQPTDENLVTATPPSSDAKRTPSTSSDTEKAPNQKRGKTPGEDGVQAHPIQRENSAKTKAAAANTAPKKTKATGKETAPEATIQFRTHVQKDGWQDWRNATASGGKPGKATAGTLGRSLRLEGIQIRVKGIEGSVSYQVHVQNIGWQTVRSNGALAGTSGKSLRLEAIRIALMGEISKWYDIEYRTHVQNIGWQGYMRNGAVAGTNGKGLRLEAIEIRLVPKSRKASSGGEGLVGVRGQAIIQHDGKQAWVRDGSAMGTTGRDLGIKSICLQLDKGVYSGSIEYRTHVQNIGWTKWRQNGQMSGTTRNNLRMEALQVRLTGDIAKYYEVAYRAYVQNIGWRNWVSGGITAGTTGRRLRVEALEVRLLPRPTVPKPERTISNGMYTLTDLSSRGYAIGTADASDATRANVHLAPNARWRLEEKWQITWKGNGYELRNINSGKILTAINGSKNMVANVVQATRDNTKTQRWAIIRSGSGYIIVGMNFGTAISALGGISSGSNLNLWSPNRGKGQRYAVKVTQPCYEGTYQSFTKLDQDGKCIDAPNGTLANNARMAIDSANDGPNQHLIFTKSGDGFAVQVVSSGKFLAVSGNDVVQRSKSNAASQVWMPSVAGSGGLVLVNASTGKVLSVLGNSSKKGAALQQQTRNNSAGQRWYLVSRNLVSNGLYELRTSSSSSIILDVNGASLYSGANLIVQERNGGNNQKFAVTAMGDGYYRINMPLSNTVVTVQGSSTANGANVCMESWGNRAAQLWKPVVTNGGLTFVNKASGKVLSFTTAYSGANVRQTSQSNAATQKWSMVKTSMNACDMYSYVNAIYEASGNRSVTLNNAVSGYSISESNWNRLMDALNACYNSGGDVAFLMVDCDTGMSLSLDPDQEYFSACTIKALYVTYLFEEYLERGRLSWDTIKDLVEPAIIYSKNEPYHELRDNYGSEEGFADWLNEVDVGYYEKWGTYSPRTLAKAWAHIMEYAESGGYYTKTWKYLFNHVRYSPIHEKLSGYRTTYSKTGWMEDYTWSGSICNDGSYVVGPGNRKYILTIMTSVDPYERYLVRNVIGALDAIHAEMPARR